MESPTPIRCRKLVLIRAVSCYSDLRGKNVKTICRIRVTLIHDWKRRWLPRDIGDHANGDSPASAREFQAVWQLHFASEGALLEELRYVPCLILLGEPGLGKTYALRREHGSLDEWTLAGLVRSHHVDLAGSQSAEDVRAQLFGNEVYREWKSGTHWLVFFIDSVDQSRTPVEKVITAISNELAAADVSRLQLRLVCRDYDWSLSLADALRHCWRNTGGAPVRVYQLAPLNSEDIRLAAKANGKDPDAFIRQVEDANALPLATIPITLEMLLQTDEITDSRIALYRSGIRRLCGLPDENAPLTEKSRVERFEIAARLAAVMVLGNKYSIDIGGSAELSESSLGIPELLHERASEDEERLLRSTLNCALFHGTTQRTWAHQSFAEYLAAHFLSQDSVSVDELLQLTTTSDGRFAPQLHETLRWLMDMRPDFLKEVVKQQPMLALVSDLSHFSELQYRSFVKTLLSLDDPYIYSKRTWDLKKFRATHPSAGRVLLPYLQDNEGNVYRRRFVLHLLKCHGYPDMEDTLVGLALNEYEDGVLRRLAARGLQKVGSQEAKLELKPYVFGREDDPDDEIKGYALKALWPCHLTAEELFTALRPPRRENLVGSYRVFLIENSIVNDLGPTDLPTALKWVAAQPSRHKMPLSLQDLPGKIMRKAWDNRHIPDMLEAFAQTVVEMTLRFDGIFGGNSYDGLNLDKFEQSFVQASEARRKLVLICLPLLSAKDERVSRLTFCRPPMVVPADLDWLLALLDSELDESRRGQVAELVARLTPHEIEKIYEASDRHHDLKQLTKHYFVSMLDDPTVLSERKYFRESKEIEENQKRQLAESRPIERIHDALNQVEAGEPLQWLNALYGLAINSGIGSSWKIEPDLTEFPNWNSCDDATRIRIIRAAVTYVLNFEYRPCDHYDENWYFSNLISDAEFAGYRAMFLLLKAGVEALDELPFSRWGKWSKIIVWFPHVPISLNDGRTEYHYQTRDLQQDLLGRLYRNAPRPLLSNLRQLLIAKDSGDSYIEQELNKVEHLWNPALETTLLDLLRDSSLSAKGQRSLLDILLKHDSDDAVRFAEQMIRKSYSDEVERESLVEFCVGLMLSELEFDWQAVWNEIKNNENVGKAIVEKIAEDDRNESTFGAHVSARDLADLFLWIEERYPSDQDPQIDGFHAVSTRKQVGQWRNSLITQIGAKNSQDAHSEIRRILDHYPQLEWIQYARVDLEETVEELDWKPALPRDVLELTVVKEKRLQIWKRKSIDFMKKNGKWLVSIVAKFLPMLFGSG